MPPKTNSNNIGRTSTGFKKAGELRRSQAITTFGPGAIADFPRFSGIMAGLDNWNIGLLSDEAKIKEGNLERLLGKEYFIQVASEGDDASSFGMPAFRFPNMYYCPECNMLDYYGKIKKNLTNNSNNCSELFCNNCSSPKHQVKLIPSRFIVSCLNGHLEDFPYIWWVHRNKKHEKSSPPKLELRYDAKTGGLDGIHIKCDCGAETTMAGCMSKDALKGLKCSGAMPWIAKDYHDPEACGAQLRTMQRSANNVYYPVTQSALTIPPWSSHVQRIIKRYYPKLEDIFDEDEEMQIRRLKKHWEKYQNDYNCTFDLFLKEVRTTFGYDEKETEINEKTILQNEYFAFCGSDVNHPYFKTETTDAPLVFGKIIDKVKLVKRLREVQVLMGFRRILPEHESNPDISSAEGIFDREFTPLSKQPLTWLPAIELFGEGIFIQFNEKEISEWEQKNAIRYLPMENRLKQSWIGKGMFSAQSCRYVMLHTFAHLLIRQLAFQCGYSAASLKEKIYSSFLDYGEPMSGILVYTAASDSDGSLGGLVRQGNKDRLENIFRAALQEASWCSNDPICIESNAQGYQSLNYSACHACTLLPETSCESANCLLDRASIVGLPEDKNVGFFNKFL